MRESTGNSLAFRAKARTGKLEERRFVSGEAASGVHCTLSSSDAGPAFGAQSGSSSLREGGIAHTKTTRAALSAGAGERNRARERHGHSTPRPSAAVSGQLNKRAAPPNNPHQGRRSRRQRMHTHIVARERAFASARFQKERAQAGTTKSGERAPTRLPST